MTGNMVTGVVFAALGGTFPDPIEQMAAVVGDVALLLGSGRAAEPAEDVIPVLGADAETLTPFEPWIPPDLADADDVSERKRPVESAPPAPAGFDPEGLDEAPRYWVRPAGVGGGAEFVGVNSPPVFTPAAGPQLSLPLADGFRPAAPQPTPDAGATAFGPRVAVNEVEPVEIPNNAPHLIDPNKAIELKVNEDDSATIDPSTFYTDPDKNPVWVKSVQGETSNGRVAWEEGGLLRYIPNPDYLGRVPPYPYLPDDTFTFTVTDGLAEVEGTVKVDVAPVNDPCAAFNDAFAWGLAQDSEGNPLNEPVGWGNGPGYFAGELLYNDIDYDWASGGTDKLTTELVSPPHIGSIVMFPNGIFYHNYRQPVHKGYVPYLTSFTYRVRDDSGYASPPATVSIWVQLGPIGGPTVTEGTDGPLVYGDETATGKANYTTPGGSMYVLSKHPEGLGRLTAFDFDGTLKYDPAYQKIDTKLVYTVRSETGVTLAQAPKPVSPLNLTLHHGGDNVNSKPVLELNERVLAGGAVGGTPLIPVFKATGGFTVGNLNDSDVDEKYDGKATDTDVPATPAFAGSGEVDLMKLVIAKPQAVGNEKVKLTVTPGGVATSQPYGEQGEVRLWRSPTKGGAGQQVALADAMNGFAVGDIPAEGLTLWIEIAGVSGQVGDVAIEAKYAEASETVSATGIWTKYELQSPYWPAGYFMANGQTALPAEADAIMMRHAFVRNGSRLGTFDKAPVPGSTLPSFRTANAELAKYLLLPDKLTPYVRLGIFSVDASRSVHSQTYDNGRQRDNFLPTPAWIDFANDDRIGDMDEDNDLVFNNGRSSTNYAFAYDAPGLTPWYTKADGVYAEADNMVINDYILRANYFDFVRIRIGARFVPGPPPAGTLVKGSRASVYYFWHSLMHVASRNPSAGSWTLERINVDPSPPGGENRIGTGHVDVTRPGG